MSKKAKKGFELKENVKIQTIRHSDGKVLGTEELHNTIVNVGKNLVRDLISTSASNYFQAIAIGTSSSGDSVAVSDTALTNEVTRASASIDTTTDYQVVFENTFTFASGEAYAIEEAGAFDSATQSGSTMLNRFTFATKNVDIDTDLKITITITVS